MASSEDRELRAVDELLRVRLQHDALWAALRVSEGALFTTWSQEAEQRWRATLGDPDSSPSVGVAFYSHLIAEARGLFFPDTPEMAEAKVSQRLQALAGAMLPLLLHLRSSQPTGEQALDAVEALSLPDLVGLVQRQAVPALVQKKVSTYLFSLPGYPWRDAPPPQVEEMHCTVLREFLDEWHRRVQLLAPRTQEAL